MLGPDAKPGEMDSSVATPRPHVLDWLAIAHDEQRRLCDLLEQIADALPGPLSSTGAERAIPSLRTEIARHSAILQHILFPVLRRRATVSDDLDTLWRQVMTNNASDELLADDTADTLADAVAAGRPANAEMLAYMLRCLFEGRRRYLAWEEALILPLARARLHPEDLAPLSEADIRALATSAKGAPRCD
jgi:hypothetical protein